MKMGRRLRCSSVTYQSRYAPSTASPARTALPAAHFDRNESHAIYGTGHQFSDYTNPVDSELLNFLRVCSCFDKGVAKDPCRPNYERRHFSELLR